MSSRHPLLSFVALACLLFTRDDVWAQNARQERLFAVVPNGSRPTRIVEIDTSAATFGRVLSDTVLSVPVWQPVSGGRFLVGTEGGRLGVFDTRLLVGHVFPLSGYLLAFDTHRPRVFLAEIIAPDGFISTETTSQLKVLDLETGVTSSLPTAPYRWTYPSPLPAAYAGLVERLFLSRWADRTIVDVVDVATGAVVQSIDIDLGPSEEVREMVTDTAGSRLFVLTDPFGGAHSPARLSAFDVATGALIKRLVMHDDPNLLRSAFPFYSLRLDEERRHLLVANVIVFDAATLERLGATGGVFGDRLYTPFAFTGPRSPFIIFWAQAIGGHYSGDPSKCVIAQLERRNAATGALEASVDIGAATMLTTRPARFLGCQTHMMMATVPRAPQHVVGAVNGRQVTLSWIDPGNTLHFDIEAGSAPGAADLLSRPVSGTTFTIDGVPSGRYHVRVRAINDVGRSVPTSDVEIIVP